MCWRPCLGPYSGIAIYHMPFSLPSTCTQSASLDYGHVTEFVACQTSCRKYLVSEWAKIVRRRMPYLYDICYSTVNSKMPSPGFVFYFVSSAWHIMGTKDFLKKN